MRTENIRGNKCEKFQVQVSNKIPVYATVSLLLAVGIYYHNGILLSGIFIVCVSGFCIYRQLFCKVVTKIERDKRTLYVKCPGTDR